jgi:hypothetical protein
VRFGKVLLYMAAVRGRENFTSEDKSRAEGGASGALLLFGVVGVLCLLLGAVLGTRAWQETGGGVETQGEIIHLEAGGNRRTELWGKAFNRVPVIRFQVGEQDITVRDSTNAEANRWRLRQDVTVRYVRSDPKRAAIETPRLWLVRWAVPFVFLAVGAAFAAVSLRFFSSACAPPSNAKLLSLRGASRRANLRGCIAQAFRLTLYFENAKSR